jgi:UDP-N-acetylmuramoyl-tripeptide--D-alanyl-D-alanine ligase
MTTEALTPLWSWPDLVAAAGASLERADTGSAAEPAVTGVSIDTRSLVPGDLFVALSVARDGHDFVTKAFAAGAAGALVRLDYQRREGDGTLLRVADPLGALAAIGRAARARLAPEARVLAVTGSAGKTGTKEMLRAALASVGPTHASERSYNNQWGVPLTLARMPAASRFAVIEIGMNHAGEITPLSAMARPHVAIVTNVLPVHLAHFDGEEGIADAKAEIFVGLEAAPGSTPDAACGLAILNRDNPHFERLAAAARARGAGIVGFGIAPTADVCASAIEPDESGCRVVARVGARSLTFRLGTPARHVALNALAVVAALDVLGRATPDALATLAGIEPGLGRGARRPLAEGVLLVDESYNANPASVAAALATLAAIPRDRQPRRIAVLGQMRELGPRSGELHLGLLPALEAAGIDVLLACGPDMRALVERLPTGIEGRWADTSDELVAPLLASVRAGDVVMIKGSLGTRMAPLVAALVSRYATGGD